MTQMKYAVRINKRIRNVRVYMITKRIGERQNFMTKLFTSAFTRHKNDQDMNRQLQGGADAK